MLHVFQIRFLRYVQAKLHALADTHSETRRSNRRKNGVPPITPEKIEEIGTRRKVCIPLIRLNVVNLNHLSW